jgi:hypothetical protein
MAHRMSRFGQAHGRLVAPLRDLAIRVTPPSTAARGLARITGWTPPRIAAPDR